MPRYLVEGYDDETARKRTFSEAITADGPDTALHRAEAMATANARDRRAAQYFVLVRELTPEETPPCQAATL